MDVGIGRRLPVLVDFDPVTAEVASGASRHPYDMVSFLSLSGSSGRRQPFRSKLSSVA